MREGELARSGKLVRLEPSQLGEIVTSARLAADERSPREAEDDAAVVRLEPEAEEVARLDFEFTRAGVNPKEASVAGNKGPPSSFSTLSGCRRSANLKLLSI